jgi:RNA polymerase sigma-70 factor (ECF subfamily)
MPALPDLRSVVPPPGTASGSACRGWYEAHGRAVYGYLRFHLPSADEAEDLTADVFLRAVRAEHRFDPARASARTWLFRIARNALLDHVRQEHRRRQVSLGALRDLHSDAPSPEERVLWEEEVGRLLSAVAGLGARDREIIGLRYGSGLETREVAEILGVAAPAARTRLWRALSRLREVLDP